MTEHPPSNQDPDSAEKRAPDSANAGFNQQGQIVQGNQINVAGNYVVQPGTTRRLTAVEEYLAAVREYCANLPYLTLHDIRPPKTLDEVYLPLKAQLAWTDEVIDGALRRMCQIVYRLYRLTAEEIRLVEGKE